MDKTHNILSIVCVTLLMLTACDKTIHEYPKDGESEIYIELNVNRLPPVYYKKLVYDNDGNCTETLLEPDLSEAYTPDEQFCVRIITEIYDVASAETKTSQGRLVERREAFVDRLEDTPQTVVSLRMPAGIYKALAWADYVPAEDTGDWHFKTESLNAVRVDLEHQPKDNHHKNSAAGRRSFSIDFLHSPAGNPEIIGDGNYIEDNTIPVHLERTSGRFKIWATDLNDFLNSGLKPEDLSIKIIYKQYISAGYNVDTQSPNMFVQTRTMETEPSGISEDGELLLAYDYVLVSDDKEDHVLADIFIYRNGKKLNHYQNIDIPLKRNSETIVRGPFLTRSIGSGDIGIEEGFDDEFIIVIPD